MLGLGSGLEGGVGVCGIVLLVVRGVFPSYNSNASLPHLNNITDHNQRSTRLPPPLPCYVTKKISVPIAWKYFMFQLLLIFSTDFWNNAPLIFHRNCQFWLERVKETNVYSDLVLQPGPTSRAMPSPKGNHNINIKWGTKSQKQPPHTTPGPGSNKDWQKLPNIDCLKLPKTMYNSSFKEGFIF